MRISQKKILLGLLMSIASVSVGIFGGELLMCSEKASEYIATLFSFLAATVFAVVSIVGDPSMLLPGNRRLAWESAKQTQLQIQRLNFIFCVHILTLLVLVISEVIRSVQASQLYWIFNILAGISTLGFLMSFGLPFELSAIQRDRLLHELKERKKD